MDGFHRIGFFGTPTPTPPHLDATQLVGAFFFRVRVPYCVFEFHRHLFGSVPPPFFCTTGLAVN